MRKIPFKDIEKICVLKIYICPDYDQSESEYNLLKERYIESIIKRQNLVYEWIHNDYGKLNPNNNSYTCVDAGFDLYCYSKTIPYSSLSNYIDLGIKCAMIYNETACPYYLYPRSSMGAKTPLRISNSVGIMDSGYRGKLIGVVDNLMGTEGDGFNLPDEYYAGLGGERLAAAVKRGYKILTGDRLFQICSPNILYPIYPILVDNVEELGLTKRGCGGFGSTGK